MSDTKRVLVTHNDLDGIACAILAKSLWPTITVKYCDYKTVDAEIIRIVIDGIYGELYITDIAPNAKTCKVLDTCWTEQHTFSILQLCDHHASRAAVAKCEWAMFDTNACGTLLFYRYLLFHRRLQETGHKIRKYKSLVEHVDVYDRWLLSHKLRAHSERLETLRKVLGNRRFINRFLHKSSLMFVKVEKLLIEIAQEQEKNYVTGATLIPYTLNGNKCPISCGDKLASNVCHRAIGTQQAPMAATINLRYNKVELRSIGDCDVSKIAKRFGGGGHKHAAGFLISDRKMQKIIKIIFEQEDNNG